MFEHTTTVLKEAPRGKEEGKRGVIGDLRCTGRLMRCMCTIDRHDVRANHIPRRMFTNFTL